MKSFFLSLITVILSLTQVKAADRIVSTAGYASEIVAILGKADHLVGVDTTSVKPQHLMEKKPKIGYRRQLSAEGILSLQPNLIILASDAGPESVVKQVKASGVTLLTLVDKQSLEGIRDNIAQIAKAIGAESQSKAVIEQILVDERKLAELRTQHTADKTALVLIDTASQDILALGKSSVGDHFLKLINITNNFQVEGSKPLSTEALASSHADVILLASRNEAKDSATIVKLAQNHPQYAQLSNTQAGKKGCVFAINILDALGFGPYTANYAHQILTTIQPCLK
ncbi:hemin ABC transporter [Mannheimia granulomatis]|uniref:heme/hemin ABC transporter substrate-binding protein n=1 Tax=Mannheimia granulomatis TaxID=85402 RepID=UPI001F3EFE97|nr:ABC transporter substrate-binding protein [Mannheimia granulomatis]QLB15332.1 hemin ABC transporter [Mannheimia granulomatis]